MSARVLWFLCLATLVLLSGPGAAHAQQRPAANKTFADRLGEATSILKQMGEQPASSTSVNYHVLYVCRKEFAEERKAILEATRRNFLGFMQRMNLKVTENKEKLLVIVVDTEDQMQRFYELAATDGSTLPGWVAGYYSPDHNWAVFYNQRKGSDIKATEAQINSLAATIAQIPGTNNAVVEVPTDKGVVRKTKGELYAEIDKMWKDVIKQVSGFNTTVTQHEGAHQIAYNVGVQDRGAAYPFWVSEGLACVFESPPSKKGDNRIGAARLNVSRLREYREVQKSGKARSLASLIALDREAKVDDINALYAESWAAFAFFFNRYPTELSAYMQHLATRKPGGADVDEVAEFVKFGKKKQTIADLQKEFDAYIAGLKE